MQKPIVLIGGGYDKGVSFDDWTKLFPGRVKHLVLIGVTAPQIRASAEKFGFTAMTDCETFAEAVDLCRKRRNQEIVCSFLPLVQAGLV